jgi:D-cysteine desulfhydrase family pyridoxal phosphate-dependent enzyme
MRRLHFPPKFPLADIPTPVHALKRLSAHLGGPSLLVKRDDMTGLALGGNKTRKLEFLVADALARGADTLVTAGAAQSNHCRQTAAAAAKAGKRCDLVLGGVPPPVPEGNLLIDDLLGARIHWAGSDRRGETLDKVAASLRAEGCTPYVIPYGGSSPLGAAGYVAAMAELMDQIRREGERIDAILFPSSSGGTHAGLIAGGKAYGYRGKIIGVCVEKDEGPRGELAGKIIPLARETAALLGAPGLVGEETRAVLDERYTGEGYGVMGDAEREAIRLLARMEGILIDPVYTAKAMAGLLDMIARREFTHRDTVLFWHTGGTPALFAHARGFA